MLMVFEYVHQEAAGDTKQNGGPIHIHGGHGLSPSR